MSKNPDKQRPDELTEVPKDRNNGLDRIANSIGVLVQSGAVVTIRNIVLPGNRAWRPVHTVLAILSSVAFITVLSWLFYENHNRSQEALILNRSTGEKADPKYLPSAQKLIKKADSLARRGESEKALNYYRKIVDYAMLVFKDETNQTELVSLPQCSSNEYAVRQSLQISCTAQSKLINLIQELHFPVLVEQLRGNRIGSVVGSQGKEFKAIFSEGALRTTYSILVKEDGIWADENDDGFVNTRQEALKLPCPLLASIEKLWKEHHDKTCGWYDAQTNIINESLGCSELKGYTLTDSIFLGQYQPVIDRLKECELVPKNVKRADY